MRHFACTGFSKTRINKTSILAHVRCCCQSNRFLFSRSCRRAVDVVARARADLDDTTQLAFRCSDASVCEAGMKSTIGDMNRKWRQTYRCVAVGNVSEKRKQAQAAAGGRCIKQVCIGRQISLSEHILTSDLKVHMEARE